MLPGSFQDASYDVPGYVYRVIRWTAGATGAVASIDSTHRYGVPGATPIVRNSAGNYTITMAGTPAGVINVWGQNKQASYSGTAGAKNLDFVSSSGNTITVQFTNAAGTATDPASGDVLTVTFELQTYVPPV